MEDTLYDLMIGNIDGSKHPDNILYWDQKFMSK